MLPDISPFPPFFSDFLLILILIREIMVYYRARALIFQHDIVR